MFKEKESIEERAEVLFIDQKTGRLNRRDGTNLLLDFSVLLLSIELHANASVDLPCSTAGLQFSRFVDRNLNLIVACLTESTIGRIMASRPDLEEPVRRFLC